MIGKSLLVGFLSFIGWIVSIAIQWRPIFRLYNHLYELSPRIIIRGLVRFVALPDKDNIWIIHLINGKRIRTQIRRGDVKSSQFALSYKWHAPAMNFTEYLLNRFYPANVPWIDVGSNLGLRSLLSLSECRSVIFIEPNRELNLANRERCVFNGFSDYEFIEAGASDTTGTRTFTIDHTTYNSTLEAHLIPEKNINRTEIIRIDSLDKMLLKKLTDRDTACIKIDVEGHELKVLDGATELISRFAPTLVIEVNNKGDHFKSFINKIAGSGYDIFELGDFGKGKYFKKIPYPPDNAEVAGNDFLAIKDMELLGQVANFTSHL